MLEKAGIFSMTREEVLRNFKRFSGIISPSFRFSESFESVWDSGSFGRILSTLFVESLKIFLELSSIIFFGLFYLFTFIFSFEGSLFGALLSIVRTDLRILQDQERLLRTLALSVKTCSWTSKGSPGYLFKISWGTGIGRECKESFAILDDASWWLMNLILLQFLRCLFKQICLR